MPEDNAGNRRKSSGGKTFLPIMSNLWKRKAAAMQSTHTTGSTKAVLQQYKRYPTKGELSNLMGNADNSEKQERLRKLFEHKRRQIAKAENHAHKKPPEVLEFEERLFQVPVEPEKADERTATPQPETEFVYNTKQPLPKAQKSEPKRKVFYVLANIVGYYDLYVSIYTLLDFQVHGVAQEIYVRGDYYNCNEKTEGITSEFQGVYFVHAIAAVLLVYSLMKKTPTFLLAWILSKICATMFLACRFAPEMRSSPYTQFYRIELIYLFPILVVINLLQLLVVFIVLSDMTRPYYSRQRHLLKKKSLNREIYYKSLPPLVQRKLCLRWAEHEQLLFSMRLKPEKGEVSVERTLRIANLTDEQLHVYYARGFQSFHAAYGLGPNDAYP